MDDLKKQVLQLTGKYDKLVQEVKTLKNKIKNDESTINILQKEVTQLKKQKVNQPTNAHNTINTTTIKTANPMNKSVSAPPDNISLDPFPPAKNTSMDPLDFFTGGGSSNNTTQNTVNAPIQNNNANMANNAQNNNAFGSWATF
eukprot:787042_1